MHVVCSIQCSFLIAQYDSYSPDHSFLSGSFILHFKGKKNVKYFGSNSAGYTSANTSIDLYDGSIMNLTTHKLKDQTGKIYINNSIIPNVKTNKPEKSALEWITSS